MTAAASRPLVTLFDPAFLAQLEKLSLVTKRARATGDRGARRSQRRGASVEFADHRAYNPGDDFRRIDWNLYGRLEKLFLKLYLEEVDLTLHLLVDASASMAFGSPPKHDLSRRIAAALAYVALAGMDRVSLGVVGEGGAKGIGPLRGKRQIFRFLDLLEGSNATGRVDLGKVLGSLPAAQGGVTVIVSDFLSPTSVEAGVLGLLAARQRVALLQVLSREELEPDLHGDFVLVDSETGAGLDVTTGPRAALAYQAGLDRLTKELEGLGRRGPCTHVMVPSDADFMELMLATLPRAWVVR